MIALEVSDEQAGPFTFLSPALFRWFPSLSSLEAASNTHVVSLEDGQWSRGLSYLVPNGVW